MLNAMHRYEWLNRDGFADEAVCDAIQQFFASDVSDYSAILAPNRLVYVTQAPVAENASAVQADREAIVRKDMAKYAPCATIFHDDAAVLDKVERIEHYIQQR